MFFNLIADELVPATEAEKTIENNAMETDAETAKEANVDVPTASIENKKVEPLTDKSDDPKAKLRKREKEVSTPTAQSEPKPTETSTAPVPERVSKAAAPEIKKQKTLTLRECLNVECSHQSSEFYEAPILVQSHFRVSKKQKTLYVCEECYDKATDKYAELCGALQDAQPLLLEEFTRPPDLVEILDSSDEEDDDKTNGVASQKGDFNQATRDLIENDLDDIITETLKSINIDQQLDWNRSILAHRIEEQEAQAMELQEELRNLQAMADQMHVRLYQSTNIFLEEMPSWDSITGREVQLADATYPPHGEYVPSKIDTNSLFYAVRQKMLAAWAPCRIVELPPIGPGVTQYKVKFLRPAKNVVTKSVPANHLAFGAAPPVRLNVGMRVIALFNMTATAPRLSNNPSLKDATPRYSYFPGIVAEPLQQYNGWRYLVFFDDGYAQYVLHENIRVVLDTNPNVWENVHLGSSEFIKNYLKQFSTRRPMVQVRKNQRMLTELNGKWINARVYDVDGSLVQMMFEDGKRLEWIYRGSTRLGPLFREQAQRLPNVTPNKRNEPAIEYIVIDDDNTVVSRNTPGDDRPIAPAAPSTPQRKLPTQAARETPQQQEQKRAVARKSSSLPPQRQPTVQHLNNSTIYVDEDNRPKGKVVYYTAKKHLPPRKFLVHDCSPACLYEVTYNLNSYSPLSKPLLSGWERQICKSKAKKVVVYRAPCGRRLRNMMELHRYLRLTKCALNVENFDFDFAIHCLAEYVIDTCIVQKNVSYNIFYSRVKVYRYF